MNREIKFRIWSLKYNQWMDHCGVIDCPGNLGSHFIIKHDDGKLEHGFVSLPKEENIIQQFTGLKDENGKEIYEGDILECYKNRGVVVFEDMEDAAFECVFIEDYLEGKRQGELMLCGENFFSVKSIIIGNIFENPELLK